MTARHYISDDSEIVLQLTARALSLISIGVILLFFLGEGINPSVLTLKEYLLLPFFPLGVLLGMIIAWKNEALGGTITTLSLALFYFMHGLVKSGGFPRGWLFFALSFPGFLFLLHARLHLKTHRPY